ncbi:hypothetical protein CU048_00880 [Beijerinckiaceae bacterium]|nr:hypothetical protein CU048_00880 [Beijerinckiaceae bacterium]
MKSAQAVKVLYFTSVRLAEPDHGGSIVCRHHAQRLAACEGTELHVSTFGSLSQAQGERKFVDTLGAQHHPILPRATRKLSTSAKNWRPAGRWPFMLEVEALAIPDVDRQFCALVNKLKPDIVVIDYLLSALFIRSVFSMPVRIITITLNKEAEFHAEMRRAGRLGAGVSDSILAQWRLARFERAVCRNSDALVVLSEGDLPSDRRVREHTAILEPVLDESQERWRYSCNRDLFFVGNIGHYPNFLAVKWLAEQFAPALAQRCPEARIRIVGTSINQIQPHWNRDNIDYMGRCDEPTLNLLFNSCDLFIAPIENNFGAKMKVMQCLARGTPILATSGALSGVTFNDLIPQFALNNAEGAADVAAGLLGDEPRLNEMSRILTKEYASLLASRNDAWHRLITNVKAQPLRHIRRPSIFSPLRPARNDDVDVSRPWSKRIEIGVEEPLGVVTTGMYGLEQVDDSPLRWTSEIAELEVPLNQKTLPTALAFRLFGISPAGGTDLRILVNGLEMFHGQVRGEPIHRTIPLPNLTGVPNLRIRLESSGFQPEGDVRKLGVAIRSIVLSR